jgi:Ca-activated chloride channel family protein
VLQPLLAAGAVLALALLAEWLHARRVRRIAKLAFGPRGQPSWWARSAPALRVIAASALAWGLGTLFLIEPRRYSMGTDSRLANDPHHVLLVLDVSPSMRLVDAGPSKKQSRMARARDVMESFFARVPLEEYRVSVVAVYNGAKPVVIDTQDFEVVRNILGDLPMHYAFRSGKTKLFDGLEEAVKIAHPWNPRSTTLVVLSDGDTVPATGMPKMPASIANVIVVGVGDSKTGKFIDGKQSRQDVPMLKQIAARLGGSFHDGNESHLSSSLIAEAFGLEAKDIFEKLTRREYALIACVAGASVLALLPLLLHLFGTRWRPGTSRGAGRRGSLADTGNQRALAQVG